MWSLKQHLQLKVRLARGGAAFRVNTKADYRCYRKKSRVPGLNSLMLKDFPFEACY